MHKLVSPQGMKSLPSVERRVIVTPSTQASSMRLTYLDGDDDEPITIEDGDEVTGVAGDVIRGISK